MGGTAILFIPRILIFSSTWTTGKLLLVYARSSIFLRFNAFIVRSETSSEFCPVPVVYALRSHFTYHPPFSAFVSVSRRTAAQLGGTISFNNILKSLYGNSVLNNRTSVPSCKEKSRQREMNFSTVPYLISSLNKRFILIISRSYHYPRCATLLLTTLILNSPVVQFAYL